MRIAEVREEGARPLEAEPDGSRRPAEEVVERVLVGGARVAQGDAQPEAAGFPVMWRTSRPMVSFSSRRCTTMSSMP